MWPWAACVLCAVVSMLALRAPRMTQPTSPVQPKAVEALSRGRCLDDLEEQDISLRFRRTRPGGTHPVESRERPRPLAFHLRTALLRTRWKYALSGRDRRSAQDGLRAAGAANPHRKRHC